MLHHVATVLLTFQRFPITPGNSMQHGCDMGAGIRDYVLRFRRRQWMAVRKLTLSLRLLSWSQLLRQMGPTSLRYASSVINSPYENDRRAELKIRVTFDKMHYGSESPPWWLSFKTRLEPVPPARAAHQCS